MVYDCGSCLAKYILCFFNFVIFLAGSAVLAVGIWLAVDKNSFIGLSKIVPNDNVQQFTQPAVIEQGSYILIGVGAFMFVVSFLGYCGALRESQCLLTTYGICLLIIIVVEITVGCLTVAYKPKAEEETRKVLKSTIEKYYSTPENKDAVTLMWDHLQASLKCCGVNNYTDYESSTKWKDSGKVIPESCCVLEGDPLKFQPKSPECVTKPSEVNSYYKKGCFNAVIHWLMTHIDIVIGIGVGLGLLELIGIFLAFCLSKALNGYIK
ncbi:hypothetical protein Zmor_027674 [Zophobas morio]|uniref:Tetraspanin n=1 Tax=Zophobas morio TaxID=2755281 RepID=A0AA38HR13_9CUCU|nr:hypothetical protein Zmor_027674 [Zophobas morio]